MPKGFRSCRQQICLFRQGPLSSAVGPYVDRAATAVGSPQRQLSLDLLGQRDCPGPDGRGHMQGEGALQTTWLGETKNKERGVRCRILLL